MLAVSGGADSMALMHLIARWRARLMAGKSSTSDAIPHVFVATVDHRLRTSSREEAEWVGQIAARLGLPHAVLTWQGDKPASAVQATARAARYELLRAKAAELGGALIVTAHHLDDQAETVLMRLARGSGVDGLSGMAPESGGIARPLLGIAKSRLEETLTALGQTWPEDSSNQNLAFERVRLRAAMPVLSEAGVSAGMIATSARRLRRASEALNEVTNHEWLRLVALNRGLAGELPFADWRQLSEDIRVRLLARLLAAFGNAPNSLILSRAETLAERLQQPDFPRQTISGCAVERADGLIRAWREAGRAGLPITTLAPGQTRIWDGRFAVSLAPSAPNPVTVQAVGLAAIRKIRSAGGALPMRDDRALATAPSAWMDEKMVATPSIDLFEPPWAQTFSATFTVGSGITEQRDGN